MFKKKVGSDACLVLDAVITLASTTATVTLDQKFNFADLVKATKTREVVINATSANATIGSTYGDNIIIPVVATNSSNSRIYATVTKLAGTKTTFYLTENSTTKVWSGTYSTS